MEDRLSRLEVLTDLIEFAEDRRAEGSAYVEGWAPYIKMTEWYKEIAMLRNSLPDGKVKEFDDERERKRQFIEQCS